MRCFLILAALCLTLPFAALAERRVGLVIGNNAYDEVPRLDKAVADAESVAKVLRAQGFDIISTINADRRAMNRSISRFTSQLHPGDTAFLFYAGHGVEIDGENYLLPTDIVAPMSGQRDFIKSESIALSALLDRVRASGARMTVAIVDACRNNPFETGTGRSIGGTRGLGRITAPQGTFVIFSAGAGQLALDELTEADPARNSVFTRALLPRLSRPDLELRDLVAELREDVRRLARTVNHEQFPAYYDELLGDFYFVRQAPTETTPSAAETAPPVADVGADQMRQDFDLARAIGTEAALGAFLDQYSDRADSFSYRMAEDLLAALKDTPPAPAAPPQDTRAIIRATQQALNDAGCSAGSADGIIGTHTRRAFARFLSDTGVDLRPGDLGSAQTLDILRERADARCAAVASAPTPEPATGAPDLTGRWQFRASCPLFIKTTGTQSFARTGATTFRGPLTDSLGQTATTRVTLNGRRMAFVIAFPDVTLRANGTLAADGNSYSSTASNGCATTAWRTR